MPASKQPRKRKAPAAAAPPSPPASPASAPLPPTPVQAARVDAAPLSDEILTQTGTRAPRSPAKPAEAPPAAPPALLRREPDAPIQANRASSSAANRERMRDVFYMFSSDPNPRKPSS